MTGFDSLNLKIPFILTILIFIRGFYFMLTGVEHEKSFITSGHYCTDIHSLDRRIN